MKKIKSILSNTIGRFNMFIGMIKDVKFCPNCKVRMSIIYKDWNRIYITRECPCCKGALMTPYGNSDYNEDDLMEDDVMSEYASAEVGDQFTPHIPDIINQVPVEEKTTVEEVTEETVEKIEAEVVE